MQKKARFETFKLHINLVIAIGLGQIWFVVGSFLVDVDLVNKMSSTLINKCLESSILTNPPLPYRLHVV